MNGTELRGLRHRLGMSQAKLAALIGVHWNTLARYERDEIAIPEPVAILARLLLKLEGQKRKPKKVKR